MIRILAASAICLAACATTDSEDPYVRYEVRLGDLLKAKPDDPDLLFLSHSRKDLAACLKLASLRPTPMVLASVVSEYRDAGVNEVNLPQYLKLLEDWKRVDPDNSVPVILKAQVDISRGDLDGGIAAIVESSRLSRCSTYGQEARRESHRIQREVGINDLHHLGAVFYRRHLDLTQAMIGAWTTLATLAFEVELRGDIARAQSYTRANLNLALRYQESQKETLNQSLVLDRVNFEAVRLCELLLLTGDESGAKSAYEQARTAARGAESLRRAILRDQLRNPLRPAFEEAGMMDEKDPLALGVLGASEEQWRRFYAAMDKREVEIRAYFDKWLEKGSGVACLEWLTEADRSELASLRFPVDTFWEHRSDFGSNGVKERALDRQVQWFLSYNTADPIAEFMGERAFHALIHAGKGRRIPRLEAELESDGGAGLRTLVILTALDNKDVRVAEQLAERVDEYTEGTCWAAGKLGMKKVIPDLIRTFSIEISTGDFDDRFSEAVTIYLALRDLTGKDFGFYSEKWENWAKSEGFFKTED